MATEEPCGQAARASTPGPWPGGVLGHMARAAGPPSGRSGRGVARLGERTPAAVEKRGPYMVMRGPPIQAKLRECGPMGSLPGRAAVSPGRAPEPRCGDPREAPPARSRSRKSVREERVPGVWEKPRSGEDPANLGSLTSRETPGPGQGRSAEERHAGGLAEPPRRFREKVSAGATSSVQTVFREGLSPGAGRRGTHV